MKHVSAIELKNFFTATNFANSPKENLLKKLATHMSDEEWENSVNGSSFELPAIRLSAQEMSLLKGGYLALLASAYRMISNLGGADTKHDMSYKLKSQLKDSIVNGSMT